MRVGVTSGATGLRFVSEDSVGVGVGYGFRVGVESGQGQGNRGGLHCSEGACSPCSRASLVRVRVRVRVRVGVGVRVGVRF